MYDHILIYFIVVLNTLCQIMLIWRLQSMKNTRWVFAGIAALVPLLLIVAMRSLVYAGAIHGHIAEQTVTEQAITKAMSLLLLAGPWLVTLRAIFFNRNRKKQAAQLIAPCVEQH